VTKFGAHPSKTFVGKVLLTSRNFANSAPERLSRMTYEDLGYLRNSVKGLKSNIVAFKNR